MFYYKIFYADGSYGYSSMGTMKDLRGYVKAISTRQDPEVVETFKTVDDLKIGNVYRKYDVDREGNMIMNCNS